MKAMSLRKWNDRSEKKFVLIALLTPADSNVRAGAAHHHQDINSIRVHSAKRDNSVQAAACLLNWDTTGTLGFRVSC